MQPFPDYDLLFEDELSPLENSDTISLAASSECIPSPDANVSIDLSESPLIDDLKSFQWMAEKMNDSVFITSVYETISTTDGSHTASARRGCHGSVGNRCSVSSDYSSPAPPSTELSPPSRQQSISRPPEESLQDALAALEKLCQPTYTAVKKVKRGSKESKAEYSFLEMIAKAILSTPQKRMILNDIYKYVMNNFSCTNNGEKAWRKSIRHNLSLNECFRKSGRCEGSKCNYWGIHPTCVGEFANGVYRKRLVRKRVRCGMKAKVSALPLSTNESLPYVTMGTHASRNGYHPYATPYATYRNEMPSTSYNNTSLLTRVNSKHTSSTCINSRSASPTGVNGTSPLSFNTTSPMGFNNMSPTSFNITSPTDLNSLSHANYSSISPTNFNSIKVDISYGNNVTTSYTNHTYNGMQGNGYTQQPPNNSPLKEKTPLTPGATASTLAHRPNHVKTSPTWSNTFGSNGNYCGLLKPANKAFSLPC